MDGRMAEKKRRKNFVLGSPPTAASYKHIQVGPAFFPVDLLIRRPLKAPPAKQMLYPVSIRPRRPTTTSLFIWDFIDDREVRFLIKKCF